MSNPTQILQLYQLNGIIRTLLEKISQACSCMEINFASFAGSEHYVDDEEENVKIILYNH